MAGGAGTATAMVVSAGAADTPAAAVAPEAMSSAPSSARGVGEVIVM